LASVPVTDGGKLYGRQTIFHMATVLFGSMQRIQRILFLARDRQLSTLKLEQTNSQPIHAIYLYTLQTHVNFQV